MKEKGVNLIGFHHAPIALKRYLECIRNALKSLDIPVHPVSLEYMSEELRLTTPLPHRENKLIHPINIFCMTTSEIETFLWSRPLKELKGKYNIVYWLENSLLPARLNSDFLTQIDEIWVPSKYMLDLVPKKPVYHIPPPLEAPIETNKASTNIFTFLTCFEAYKNDKSDHPFGAIHAFQQAFSKQENVRLLIKMKNTKQFCAARELKEYIQHDSRIKFVDDYWEHKKFITFLNECDCYVSLHRINRFGLTVAEALMLEKPVIATDFSGSQDFVNHQTGYPCAARQIPRDNGSWWADPDLEDAARLMKHVFENPQEASRKGLEGKQLVLQQLGCATSGLLIQQRLEFIDTKQKSFTSCFVGRLPLFVKSVVKRSGKSVLKYSRRSLKRLKNFLD